MTGGRHLQVLQPSFLRWPLASEEAANLEETRGFYVEIEGTSARFPKNSIYIYILLCCNGREMEGKLARRTKDLNYDWQPIKHQAYVSLSFFKSFKSIRWNWETLATFSLGIWFAVEIQEASNGQTHAIDISPPLQHSLERNWRNTTLNPTVWDGNNNQPVGNA